MIRSKAVDYLMAVVLTIVVMISIYNLGSLHFERLTAVYFMMIAFGIIVGGGCAWIISLGKRVDELEEELEQLKRFR